jgi:hypothetical protein
VKEIASSCYICVLLCECKCALCFDHECVCVCVCVAVSVSECVLGAFLSVNVHVA